MVVEDIKEKVCGAIVSTATPMGERHLMTAR